MPAFRALAMTACLLLPGAVPACGTGPAPATPRACSVLSDGDIQAATHEVPSSVGGGDAGDHSTCVWALPNQAGGSVSALLITCPNAAACSAPLASLAPPDRFTTLAGLAAPARITVRADGRDGVVIARGGSVLQLQVDHLDVDARAALTDLARRSVPRL